MDYTAKIARTWTTNKVTNSVRRPQKRPVSPNNTSTSDKGRKQLKTAVKWMILNRTKMLQY